MGAVLPHGNFQTNVSQVDRLRVWPPIQIQYPVAGAFGFKQELFASNSLSAKLKISLTYYGEGMNIHKFWINVQLFVQEIQQTYVCAKKISINLHSRKTGVTLVAKFYYAKLNWFGCSSLSTSLKCLSIYQAFVFRENVSLWLGNCSNVTFSTYLTWNIWCYFDISSDGYILTEEVNGVQ